MTTPAEHARVWRRAAIRIETMCEVGARDRDLRRLFLVSALTLNVIAGQYEELAKEQKT